MFKKTILLALMMPMFVVCGDNPFVAMATNIFKSWQQFSQQHPYVAEGIRRAATEMAVNKIEGEMHNAQVKKIQEQHKISSLHQERLKLESDATATINKINTEREQQATQSLLLNQQLDRCLNEHGRSKHNSHGFPERCNSPARRYAAFNETAADLLIEQYKKRRKSALKTTHPSAFMSNINIPR